MDSKSKSRYVTFSRGNYYKKKVYIPGKYKITVSTPGKVYLVETVPDIAFILEKDGTVSVDIDHQRNLLNRTLGKDKKIDQLKLTGFNLSLFKDGELNRDSVRQFLTDLLLKRR